MAGQGQEDGCDNWYCVDIVLACLWRRGVTSCIITPRNGDQMRIEA